MISIYGPIPKTICIEFIFPNMLIDHLKTDSAYTLLERCSALCRGI